MYDFNLCIDEMALRLADIEKAYKLTSVDADAHRKELTEIRQAYQNSESKYIQHFDVQNHLKRIVFPMFLPV